MRHTRLGTGLRGSVAMLLVVCIAMPWKLQADNITWVGTAGGGDGSDWGNANNWSNVTTSTLGDVPATGDRVLFSNACPNAAQTIALNGTRQINRVNMTATGSRSYTLNPGTPVGELRLESTAGSNSRGSTAIFLSGTAGASLTFNVDLVSTTDATVGFANDNATHRIIVNGDTWADMDFMNGTTTGPGTIELHGEELPSSDGNSIYGGEVLVFNANALSRSLNVRGGTISLVGTDISVGVLEDNNAATTTFRINEAGSADRKITTIRLKGVATHTIILGANAGGSTGNLSLELNGPSASGAALTDALGVQTTVAGQQVIFNYPSANFNKAYTNSGVISGPARFIKRGNAAPSYPTSDPVINAVQTYTGGTWIEEGRLRLGSSGSLPDVATVQIDGGATLDLNGTSDTIGRLAGGGSIALGTAALTVTEGVSPGTNSTAMTLSVTNTTGSGSITISGGTCVFHITDLANFDKVTFRNNAALTIGGVLQVVVPPGFSSANFGDYVIFDLNGGAVGGTFSSIVHNLSSGSANVSTASGDVVLTLGGPAGTMVLIK